MPVTPFDTDANETWLGRRANVIGYYGPTVFAARRDAGTLTLTTGSATTITFDTEEGDEDGAGGSWFVHSTGIATAPRDGWYLFSATATVPNLDDAERAFLELYVNGSVFRAGGRHFSPTADAAIAAHLTTVVKLQAGDTVDVRLTHNEGANQTATVGSGFCWFSGAQLR